MAEEMVATQESTSALGRGKCYLYAFAEVRSWNVKAAGIGGSRVVAVADGSIAAIVSSAPHGRLRPERAHLAAHQAVLKELMESSTVLPVTFGTVAASSDAIRHTLAQHRYTLSRQLERVAGKVEMGLRVNWDVPNIFDYFVNTHAELRMARDRLVGQRGEPRQEEKIEIGRLFDRLLNQDREAYAQQVIQAISPACFEVKSNLCRSESEVMNLACLVGRNVQREYDSAIFTAASRFDQHYAFDYNGPWAPHSFVKIDLEN